AEEVTSIYSNRNQQRNKDMYYDYEARDEHLQSLPRFIDDGEESDSSADNDQCEIVTDTEDSENEIDFSISSKIAKKQLKLTDFWEL
ncbi:unnamed protein product, partial [Rotaria magnacalcarata]